MILPFGTSYELYFYMDTPYSDDFSVGFLRPVYYFGKNQVVTPDMIPAANVSLDAGDITPEAQKLFSTNLAEYVGPTYSLEVILTSSVPFSLVGVMLYPAVEPREYNHNEGILAPVPNVLDIYIDGDDYHSLSLGLPCNVGYVPATYTPSESGTLIQTGPVYGPAVGGSGGGNCVDSLELAFRWQEILSQQGSFRLCNPFTSVRVHTDSGEVIVL